MATTVSITTIQGSDNVGLSRLTINANFSALQSTLNSVCELLDPKALTLTGINSLQVSNSASSLSSVVLSVGNAASILGNTTLGTVGASTSVSIVGTGGVSISQSSLTLGSGNLTLSNSSSLLSASGAVSFSGEYRAPGVATAFSSIVSLTSSTPRSVPVAGIQYLIVTNGGTGSDAPAGYPMTLQSGSAAGQVVEIYHLKGPSGPVNITASNFAGLTGSIVLSSTGDKLKCIYDGGSWYLWDFTNGQITGATGSVSVARTM